MKRLLTMIALACAIAAPAAAAPKDPGKPDMYGNDPHWVKDVLYKCVIYTSRPDPKAFVRWYGKCVNGVAEGQGSMVWYVNNRYAAKYEGPVVKGARHGRGTYWAASGDRFTVEWVFGIPHGAGTWVYADGSRLEARFYDGEARGFVTYAMADGGYYSGDANGAGEIRYQDGRKVQAKMAFANYRKPVVTPD